MIGTNSTEATQSNELPGYEPPFKERRLSRKLILRRDFPPRQNSVWTPTLRQNSQDVYVSDDQDEENVSPEQVNSLDKSRNETSHYPIFTETILENTQFQNVLVENINRILETSSSERVDVSMESGSHDAISNNNSLQEQVKHAIDNIIMSTERDPTFQQVLDDVVQHTAIQDEATRTSANDVASNSNENSESPVPLKQRLRNRSQDKPRPNYNETDQNSKQKKPPKAKVEVISNEIVSGEIHELLHPNTAIRNDNYVPLNQILYLNPERSTTTFGQDLVYVNVGGPAFRIDDNTPMYLQDISLANNGTSLIPGSIINLPTFEQQIQPIQSMLPNVVIKDIVEVSKTKQPIARSSKTTPSVSKNMAQVKARNLSSPRRQSHVRLLNFTTSDDLVNETERLKSKRSVNDKKLEPVSSDAVSSQKTNITEVGCVDSNQIASLEEVETQQDSSDAVDFSKEFDEATVISVELSAEATKSECTKEEKPAEVSSEKKKPQTRQQCQRDLEMWNQMRQMKKGEWDNYLRQTVASGNQPVEKKKIKKRKSKIGSKSDEANGSAENCSNTTIDIEGRLLEEALQSAKKSVPSVIEKSSVTEDVKEREETKVTEATKVMKDAKAAENSKATEDLKATEVTKATEDLKATEELKATEVTKATNGTEYLNPSSSSAASTSAQKSEAKNPCSPNKRVSCSRRKLIQIKLPASAKKKPNMTMKRRQKPVVKRDVNSTAKVQKRVTETTRIDPSQTIDIDLISPIEHPKELNNVVKSGVNLNSFLETPSKESSSFKFPTTPGFAMSSIIKTPGVRLMNNYDSLIKFPEYPTPSFAITPGRTKTPASQSSSQKDGSSYNRATDYSSGSSYYKPDESDDIDKNLETLIRENRAQTIECNLGVESQHNINFCIDRPVLEGELSDTSTSTSSSSQTSSTSTCSSSPSSAEDNTQIFQDTGDAKRLLMAERTQQQLRLEQVRLRTMATLKSDQKIERFRKPKTKISLQRQKVADGMMKKPVQTLKMTGNSTPKVAPKILPKHVNKPNPKTVSTTPSKRKIATPRRVIYLDYKDAVKATVRIESNDRKQAEKFLTHSNDNAIRDTFKPIKDTNPQRPATPTETIDAIKSHIAYTCQNSFAESAAKTTNENPTDTPNLLQQLQGGKNELTSNASTPEMGPPAAATTKRATLVRELFGDGTMSDSDFMDTPVKIANKSQGQTNVSQETKRISLDSITNDLTLQKSVKNIVKIDNNLPIAPKPIVAASTTADSNSNNLKEKDIKSKDSKTDDSKATDSIDLTTKGSSTDSIIEVVKDLKGCDAQESLITCRVEEDSVNKVTNAKGSIAVDSKSDKCNRISAQLTTIDSHSESDDDDDDYDECTLIPSMPTSGVPNRIDHRVISETKECAIKLNSQSLDMRPMTTYLDDNTIVKLTTCDEVIIYTATPTTESPSKTTSSGSKSSVKQRTNTKISDRVKKVDLRRFLKEQKFPSEVTDNSAPEKNARFNIIAKHKGPIVDGSSSQNSSR